MMDPGLQELFSRLKSPAAASDNPPVTHHQQQPHQSHQSHQSPQPQSIWAQAAPGAGYQQPSVSSPIFSPPAHTPNPHHPSAVMSPVPNFPYGQSPVPDQKANNLLNLLKFSATQQPAHQQSPLASMQNIAASAAAEQPHSRNVSASDLVASFQPKQAPSSLRNLIASPPQLDAQAPPQDTQNFLLGLLRKPQQATAVSATVESPIPQPPAAVVEDLVKGLREATIEAAVADVVAADVRRDARESTPVRQFGADSREETQFEAPDSAKKGPVFTYVNPFQQLSASSTPSRAPKPEARTGSPKVEKHGRDVSGSADGDSAPLAKTRKLVSTQPSPTPSPVPVHRPSSQSASSAANVEQPGSTSVAQALSDVGEAVEKQVEKALAAASDKVVGLNGDKAPAKTEKVTSIFNNPKPTDPKSTEDVADSWESAEAEENSAKSKNARVVPVYNFPMKPFVSIEIKKADNVVPVRPESIMDVARLKKDFEQIDRTLVTASTNHIVYSMSKDGGFRIIRQDSGKDKKVFRGAERIFNLNITPAGSGSHEDTESILGTGVDGSIFWTNIVKVEGDAWDEYNLESQGFILPPVPVQDDNTSGSPVKTRAKMSSRHAEFFAISRGKSIYIISPYIARQSTYADKKTRIVDNQKYLDERCIKINTGKAGKDFAFSEDDSLLVSLDKSGRIKFWDIRDLAEAAQDKNAGRRAPIEMKAPLMTLTATLPLEKATPSSIMFVDKERPCVKGVALRYLIVGLKQNHILQLWDLGLGKPVQEIHFPHDKDSDAICSIAYHPKTGIIVLGHPTRNSIYFIHLSAPRYNIQGMDQARYVTMLASEDPALAGPESTAIMSGIRELSFASKGQLRSVDMLKSPVPSGSSESALFELYAMHSKGVTTITIKHEDLGWSPESKVLSPKDAQATGYIAVTDLRATTAPASATPSEAPSEILTKAPAKLAPIAPPQKVKPEPVAATSNGAPKVEKPKKTVPEILKPAESVTNPSILTPASYSLAAQKSRSPSTDVVESPKKLVAAPVAEKQVAPTANGFASVDEALSRELGALYRKLDDDRRVQDAAAAAKQDAVLRLVSSTLTDNVERSLSQIVTAGITNNVLPSINGLITAAVDRQLGPALSASLSTSVSREVKAAVPQAITLALQDKDIQRTITEHVATKVSAQVEQVFGTALRNSIVPNFTKLATAQTEKSIAEVERRFADQLRQSQVQHQHDNAKIEQLTHLVMSLSSTIDGMAASQAAFQEQILKLQRQGSEKSGSVKSASTAYLEERTEVAPVMSEEEQEYQHTVELMKEGKYEEATIQWLQSPRQGELFDKLFVRVNPQYLLRLSPLVSLSVSAALTSSFENHVDERLDWLATVLQTIDLSNGEIREIAPKIMDVLQQRMQGAYMQLAETKGHNPALQKIASLSRQINDIKKAAE